MSRTAAIATSSSPRSRAARTTSQASRARSPSSRASSTPAAQEVIKLESPATATMLASFVMLRELSGKDGTLVRVVFDGCVPAQSGVFANKQGLYDAITTCRKGAAADERAALDRLASFLHAH